MDKEGRQFERLEVSISCTVTHMGETIKGRITNISLGGALITQLTTLPPPEKAVITVSFRVEKKTVEIKASVDSRVARNFSEIGYGGISGSIGIQFQNLSKTEHSQLESILGLIVRLQQERDMLSSRLRES